MNAPVSHNSYWFNPSNTKAFDVVPLPIVIVAECGSIVHANTELLSLFGYVIDELYSQPLKFLLPQESKCGQSISPSPPHREPKARVTGTRFHTIAQHKNGSEFSVDTFLHTINGEWGFATAVYFFDCRIDQARYVELERMNRILRLVHDCNEILIRARSEYDLLSGVIRRMVEHGNYPLVWAGLLPVTEIGSFDVTVCAGSCSDCIACSWLIYGKGIPCKAIRAGRDSAPQLCGGEEKPLSCPIAESGRTLGSITLPLIAPGATVGYLNVSSSADDAFSTQEIELLKGLADDLAFGLDALRERTLHQHGESRLRLLERAVAASANAIIITDAINGKHPILHINPAFERITGYSAKEVVGNNSRFLLGSETGQPGLVEIRAALREKREGQALLKNFRKDGSEYWNELTVAPVRDEHDTVTHYISVMNDVTARVVQKEQIERYAFYDELTGLLNRSQLFERIDNNTIDTASDHECIVGILLIALNRFSLINDAYGHDVGDELLRLLGARLVSAIRPRDTAARLGGDEFVILLTAPLCADDVLRAAEDICSTILAPFPLLGIEIIVSASLGIAICPRDGGNAETLIRNAKMAAQKAKRDGQKAFQFYSEEMNRRASERLELEFDLRHALENHEFELHYQPIVDLATHRIVEVEALLRWHRPNYGMVPPDLFIPLAEETGLIVPIGSWVLNEACRQNAAWRNAGIPPFPVAVNLSARQFNEQGLEDLISEALLATGLDGSALVLEVTESMLMANIDEAIITLQKLKFLGVHLSLDDFGTGYSSLAYLKKLPLDTLKIDRSFVREIATHPNDAAIVVTVISMARAMNLSVIAEGVETEAQLEFLRTHKCQCAQGYLLSLPARAADMGAIFELFSDDWTEPREGQSQVVPAPISVTKAIGTPRGKSPVSIQNAEFMRMGNIRVGITKICIQLWGKR